VITEADRAAIETGLRAVLADATANPAMVEASGAEDVHSFVEGELIRRIGDAGKRLHTGRSRNDQVATDLRLWCRDACDGVIAEIRALQLALIGFGERERDTIIPGYTHLQRAQPILAAHWCLAYVEMLERDAGRLRDARARLNECPLGSAALAGTAYPIDRVALAADLGFDRPTANSLDGVGSRDVVVEVLAAATICALTLTRFAEDLIVYATGEFGLIKMSERIATGSSIMPQKKNPDALELLRGKAGRVAGAFTALAMTTKGLPLAYNKDLQEDKEPLFDAIDTIAMCLRVAALVAGEVSFDRARARAAAQLGYANATDLADELVRRGEPFREAHEVAGRVVREATARGCAIEELPGDVLRSYSQRIDAAVVAAIALDAVVGRRDVPGGTAPGRVHESLVAARRRVESGQAGLGLSPSTAKGAGG
jgi:argininosuccinate lyase